MSSWKVCSVLIGRIFFFLSPKMSQKITFGSQHYGNLPRQSVSHWYWSTALSIPSCSIMVIWCCRPEEITPHYSLIILSHFRHKVGAAIIFAWASHCLCSKTSDHSGGQLHHKMLALLMGCTKTEFLLPQTYSNNVFLARVLELIDSSLTAGEMGRTVPTQYRCLVHCDLFVVNWAEGQDHQQRLSPFNLIWALITIAGIKRPSVEV